MNKSHRDYWVTPHGRAERRRIIADALKRGPVSLVRMARRFRVTPASIREDVKIALGARKPTPAARLTGWSLYCQPAEKEVVMARDSFMCQYCGAQAGLAEHVVPASRGGPGKSFNLVAACYPCNATKQARVWVPANVDVLAQESPAWASLICAMARETA